MSCTAWWSLWSRRRFESEEEGGVGVEMLGFVAGVDVFVEVVSESKCLISEVLRLGCVLSGRRVGLRMEMLW